MKLTNISFILSSFISMTLLISCIGNGQKKNSDEDTMLTQSEDATTMPIESSGETEEINENFEGEYHCDRTGDIHSIQIRQGDFMCKAQKVHLHFHGQEMVKMLS